MQRHSKDSFQDYTYACKEPVGEHFDPAFTPDLTPQEMLTLGVFGGHYFKGVKGGIPADLPKDWFASVKLSDHEDKEANCFKVNASQSLEVWRKKGWIHPDDPHGWFQWYCRYYLGRRHADDYRQIARWKAMIRHVKQVERFCEKGDINCRPRQRQALLHWGYDSRRL